MRGEFAVGHIQYFRLGDALLFDKIYLHSLEVNLQSFHPVNTTINLLREAGVVEELPEDLVTDELKQAYPLDLSPPPGLDADMLFARLADTVHDATIRWSSLALRQQGRSCTLLVDEQALVRTKSTGAQPAPVIAIETLRAEPDWSVPAHKLMEMREDSAINTSLSLMNGFIAEVAATGFDNDSVEAYVLLLDSYQQQLKAFHQVSFVKDTTALCASHAVAGDASRLQTVAPYNQGLSAHIRTIPVFPPELALGGAPLALLR